MKKQLLTESEIRKMMKFANIGALTDTAISRLVEQDMMAPEDEEGVEAPEDEEEVTAEDPPMDDMGLADDESGAEGGEQEVLDAVSGAMEMFQDALRAAGPAGAAAADAITVQDASAPGEEADMDAMGGEELPDAGEELPDAGEELPTGDEELEEALEETEVIDEDEVMNEVTRRVARRLMALKRSKKR